jgi:hypothetical protein
VSPVASSFRGPGRARAGQDAGGARQTDYRGTAGGPGTIMRRRAAARGHAPLRNGAPLPAAEGGASA